MAAGTGQALTASRWWTPLRPRLTGPVNARLLVAPHAGGGPSSYARVVGELPADVEILGLTLPGRERRLGEPAGASLDDVLASLDDVAGPWPPTVVFGHSLGASLGLHLAHRLGDRCAGLVASGQTPSARDRWVDGLATDDELLRLLDLSGGTVPEALAHPAWRAAVLDALRADLRLGAQAAERGAGLRLEVGITAVAGREDLLIEVAALPTWSVHTTARCSVHLIDGGHFSIFEPAGRAVVAELVAAVLAAGRE
ncbi:thioesterase II family protein [Catellatospora methionotrophica]|uniref:thioesterase II family protein n=1 Tax=Catellatospora methionotrophica TaxID=121620 RepID=UPI0033DEF5A3